MTLSPLALAVLRAGCILPVSDPGTAPKAATAEPSPHAPVVAAAPSSCGRDGLGVWPTIGPANVAEMRQDRQERERDGRPRPWCSEREGER